MIKTAAEYGWIYLSINLNPDKADSKAEDE